MSVSATSPSLNRLLLLSPVLLTLLCLIAIPLGIMGYISLLPRNLYGGVDWSADWQWQSYIQLFFQEDFDGNLELNWVYAQALLRSVLQAGGTTLLCFLFGFPVALWMSSLSERSRNIMVLLITIPFWTNLLIRNYAWLIILREHGWLAQGLNALFPQAGGITLLYNDFAVVVGLVYSFLPFMILPIYSSVEKLDGALIEAALDLGAGPLRAFSRVIVPLTSPGIAAGVLLVFVPALGIYAVNDILGGGRVDMIGNIIENQFKGNARNWPFGAALGTTLLVGFGLIYWFVNRRQRAAF